MIEQKEFSLFNPKPEEDYLNEMALQGLVLQKVDEQGYHFKETDPIDAYYLVEFYENIEESVDLSIYQIQNFELVSQFFTKKGIWLYFLGHHVEEPIQRHMTDRDSLLDKAIKRVEMFGITLSGFIIIFSIFYIIKENSIYFWILLLLGAGFLVYILKIYFGLRKMRKIGL